MKKLLLLAVAATLVACAPKEVDYMAQFEAGMKEYQQKANEIIADAALSEDQKAEKLEDMVDQYTETFYNLGKEALEKHSDDSVGVAVLSFLYQVSVIDDEKALEFISKLGPNAASDVTIQEIKKVCSKVSATAKGRHFLDFAIPQPDGGVKSLSDYAGKGNYCLVDFWASWCAPCKREIPSIRKAYEKYGSRGLTVVSVAVWDDPQASRDTAEVHGICWNQILGAGQVPTDLYGVQGIPFIFLIGPDGTILERNLRGEEIYEKIGEYL